MRAGDADLSATIAQVRDDVRRAYFADLVVADARLTRAAANARLVPPRARETAQARFDDRRRAAARSAAGGAWRMAASDNEAIAAEGGRVRRAVGLNALLAQPLETVQPLASAIDAEPPVATGTALALARTGSNAARWSIDRRIDEQRA